MPRKQLKRPTINGRRSKVWYVVWSENGRSKRYSTGTASKVEAERVLAEIETVRPPQSFDIEKLCSAYRKAKVSEGKSDANIETSLKPILKALARHSPHNITQQTIRDYISRRSETVKASTIARELATLRAAMNWGVQENWMDRAPVIKIPSAGPPRRRFLTRAEFAQLESVIETLHIKIFLSIAINTASRGAKILSLKWDDVDFDRRLIWFERGTANKRTQVVPINASLMENLKLAQQFAAGEYVVEYNGKRVKSVRKAFDRALVRAGLKDVTIHDLRRTAASWALMAGASFDDIAALLNDDVRIVQKHYAQFSPDHIRSVVDKLG